MAKTVSFGAFASVSLGRAIALSQKEFPDVPADQIELHANSRAMSVEMCVYQKHEPLTPIESPTPGKVAGQFIWGNGCRVSFKEALGVKSRCFPDADEKGGVVLFVNSHGRLVMEPAED